MGKLSHNRTPYLHDPLKHTRIRLISLVYCNVGMAWAIIRRICAFTIFAILSNFFKDNKCLTGNIQSFGLSMYYPLSSSLFCAVPAL
jgi:hypothetical protein